VTAELLMAALIVADSSLLPPVPPRVFVDRDGDLWEQAHDDMLSPLSGCLWWALPGSAARREFVEAEFGPLREVTPDA
jgi:hypothetical protein